MKYETPQTTSFTSAWESAYIWSLYEDGGRRVTCTDGTLRGAYVLIFTSNELTRQLEDTEGSWSAYEVGRREERRRATN